MVIITQNDHFFFCLVSVFLHYSQSNFVTILFHSLLSLARSSMLLMFTSFSLSSFKTLLYHVVMGRPLGLEATRINSFIACLHGVFSGRRNT